MIELYFIDQCPARLCRALARIPGTVRAYGRPAPELQKLFLRGHGGSSAALVVQQEDAIRNAAGPFDTGVREYSEKELARSGSEATEGKSELSALMICFAALLMAGVRLICLAGRRRFRMPLRLTTRGLPGRRPFRNAWAPARKGFSPGQEPPVPAEAPPMHSPGQDAGYRGCAENEAGPGLTRSRP